MFAGVDPTQVLAGVDGDVQRILELLGVIAFALSGGLLASHKDYDLVGVVALSAVTGLGGGIMRDVILGDTPPVAFVDQWFLVAAMAAGVVVMGFHAFIDRHLRRPVLVFDAVGLGLFCVIGTIKADGFGVAPVAAVALGVLTAAGGGVARDVLAGERPEMFRADSVLFSLPAAAGGAVMVVALRQDADIEVIATLTALGVTAFRLAALRFDWHAPRPRAR